MVRLLVLVAFLFSTGCATTTNNTRYARMIGEGATQNLALQDAFTKAIEQETGVLVLSERESQSLKLVKNDILGYSSGYVDDFRIISTETVGYKVYVTVDVLVSDSKIKNRILSESKTAKDFNGTKHGTQYGTYVKSRESGDKILSQILSDYPSRAYNVYQSPYKIELDNYRNAIIIIPIKFGWNPNYMESLNDALERIQDVPNMTTPHKGFIDTIVKKPNDWFGSYNRYYFNDLTVLRRINVVLDSVAPMIKTRALTKNNTVIIEGCITPNNFLNSRQGQKFFSIRSTDTTLVGNTEVYGAVTLMITPDKSHLLSDINRVELSVVSHFKC